MANTLSVENLSKFYGRKQVVKGISFSMENGSITGLLGPNGAGKTTTFYMIVGFIKSNGGKILLDNENITNLPMHKRSKLGLSYLPQESSIFRKLTVEDNIKLVVQTRNDLSKIEKNLVLLNFESNMVILYLEEKGEEPKLQELLLLIRNSYFLMNLLQVSIQKQSMKLSKLLEN